MAKKKAKTNEELIALIKKGHVEYGEELYMNNRGMVRSIVYSIADKKNVSKLDIEDMEGAGNLALWDAVLKFDTKMDCKFSTYAYQKVQKGVLEFLRKNKGIPVEVSRNGAKVAEYIDKFYIKNYHRISKSTISNFIITRDYRF